MCSLNRARTRGLTSFRTDEAIGDGRVASFAEAQVKESARNPEAVGPCPECKFYFKPKYCFLDMFGWIKYDLFVLYAL
jgi:hypothetical protein